MSISIFLVVIFLVSFILWFRYLYIKTLKNKANRVNAAIQIAEFAIYIPIGVQAVFLFCFAFFKLLPLSNESFNFFEALFFKSKKMEFICFII